MHKQIYSLKCSYYAHALSCAHFGKLQIIYKKSGWRVKNKVLMIFDALVNIFPGNSLGWGTKFCNWKIVSFYQVISIHVLARFMSRGFLFASFSQTIKRQFVES